MTISVFIHALIVTLVFGALFSASRAKVEVSVGLEPSSATETNQEQPNPTPRVTNQIRSLQTAPIEALKYEDLPKLDNTIFFQEPTPIASATSSDTVLDMDFGTNINLSYSLYDADLEGENGLETALSRYISRLQQHLHRFIGYTEEARDKDIEGVVVLSFEISAKGAITNLKVSKSSGSEILDTAATDLFKEAGTFPSPPAVLIREHGDPMKMNWRIVYNLTE